MHFRAGDKLPYGKMQPTPFPKMKNRVNNGRKAETTKALQLERVSEVSAFGRSVTTAEPIRQAPALVREQRANLSAAPEGKHGEAVLTFVKLRFIADGIAPSTYEVNAEIAPGAAGNTAAMRALTKLRDAGLVRQVGSSLARGYRPRLSAREWLSFVLNRLFEDGVSKAEFGRAAKSAIN